MSLSLDAEKLRVRVRAGGRFSYRHFHGHTARADDRLSNAVFSQFYPCSFTIDNQTFS